MMKRLTAIAGAALAVLTATAPRTEAQFNQRGIGAIRLDGPKFARPAPIRFAAKPTARRLGAEKPETINLGRRKIVVDLPPNRGGVKKPPRDQTTDSRPPRRPDQPGKPPKTGDGKPPVRPPVIVVLPPGIERPSLPLQPSAVPPFAQQQASTPIPPLRLLPRILPPPPSAPPGIAVQPPEFVTDEVLITVPATVPTQLEMDVAALFNVAIIGRTMLPMINARLVRLYIPDGRDVPALVAALGGDARIMSAQPNYFYRPSNEPIQLTKASLAPTPVPGLQYALVKLGTDSAHRLSLGRGARIAVIDSGVDHTHPDLAATSIEQFDATGERASQAQSLDSHGTGIVGIIAARGTVQGVAPLAEIMSAKVFRNSSVSANNTATSVAILMAITWSAEKGARVLNMSFAGPRDPLVERHIKTATARGIISVAAAGNFGADAKPAYPAAYEDALAVTAIDAQDRLYVKANRGSYVALSAPGVDVIVPAVGNAHHFQSGTSFAAAHVSGIIALMLEVNPKLTVAAMREMLLSSAEDLGVPGRDPDFGAGRIDVSKVLVLAGR